MVCRYCPWWLSCQEFSGAQVGYLSYADWTALPLSCQPLLRHLVVDNDDGEGEAERADIATSRSTRSAGAKQQQQQQQGQQQKRRHGSIENEFLFCDVIQPEKQACTAPYANVGLETARPQTANSGVLVPLQRQYLLQQQQLEEQKEEEEERVEPRPRL